MKMQKNTVVEVNGKYQVICGNCNSQDFDTRDEAMAASAADEEAYAVSETCEEAENASPILWVA